MMINSLLCYLVLKSLAFHFIMLYFTLQHDKLKKGETHVPLTSHGFLPFELFKLKHKIMEIASEISRC